MQRMSELSIALNRFGLGARGGDPLPHEVRGDLLAQLDRYDPAPPPIAALPGSGAMLAAYASARRDRREQRMARDEQGSEPAVKKIKGVGGRHRARFYDVLERIGLPMGALRIAIDGGPVPAVRFEEIERE